MPNFAALKPASERLDAWIEGENFSGWDPYDALNSPLLKRLTFGNRRIGQVWVQMMKLNPINFRPMLGVPKGYNPKGMGLFLASYWRKYLLTGKPPDLERVKFFFEWLQANVSLGYHGACWGYNFPWPNRGFFAPAGTPTIVNTSFIGLALLDLVRLPAANVSFATQAKELARSACEFLLQDLYVERAQSDELAFSYTPLDQRIVHNASLMGAWLLAEVGVLTGESTLCETALKACRFTVRRQRDDGAWVYGVTGYDAWVDNFHTGYVLMALKQVSALTLTSEFGLSIEKGYNFWKNHFFLPDGMPKYYENKIYPLDAHCVAQAILTFLVFSDTDPQAVELAYRTAHWGVTHMQSKKGSFYYQIRPAFSSRIPYMRWTQAWMQRALTELEFQSR